MRTATILSMAVLWLFQNFDFFGILDKYGLPTAGLIAIFIFFNARDKGKEAKVEEYRQATLTELKEQNNFLAALYAEARTANNCKFEK